MPKRRGNIVNSTAYNMPTSGETMACIAIPAISAVELNSFNCSTVAFDKDGITPAARRLMGYQILPCEMRPKTVATRAMATPPARPPLRPAE